LTGPLEPSGRKEGRGEPVGGVQTFLIADIRGYTRFTQEHGDEAAGELASRFAEVARDGIERNGGRLLELRGDEALAVFDSPRRALLASVDLQDRFLQETEARPDLPLGVGIGVDAGEAVPVAEGYRGGALNLAARLCSAARPGEVLASPEVVHFARKVPGISYVWKGQARLKGLPEGVHIVRVVSEKGDPAEKLAALASQEQRKPRRHRMTIPAIGAAIVAGAIATYMVMNANEQEPTPLAADSAVLVDPDSGEVLDSVRVGARPSGVAAGGGAIWLTNSGEGTVSRIDPSTGAVVDTISVGSDPIEVAYGYESVWVTNGADATVTWIDPSTNSVADTIQVAGGPAGIATGMGSVWVSSKLDDTVWRLDPSSGEVIAVIDVGDGPNGLAVGPQSVWVTNQFDGTVAQINPESNSVNAFINVGSGPRDVAVSERGVWVTNSLDGTVSRIDPDNNSVVDVIPVGTGPGGITLGPETVWVSNESDQTITKIDVASNEVVGTIPVGGTPGVPVLADGELWVAAQAAEGHRGGTLTIVQSDALDSIDPALGYSPQSYQLLSMTNDGLVDFRRVGGAEGATLVPNLATALPTPTEGGKTYTFRLRDVRYSSGDPVQADDVRHSLERTIRFESPTSGYYRAIQGAESCTPIRCDLSKGIVTDNATGTVTFYLDAPDPDFLFKLALPSAFVLPLDTPTSESREPLPATGPYMIASYEPRHQIELVRNPEFREWSPAAQPDGYVDEIVWKTDVKPNRQVADVMAGLADWMEDPPPIERVDEISRITDQVHFSVGPEVHYMALNNRAPPFDDIRVRRALNYAVDRDRIADIYGGAELNHVTCQVLPPNLPSYEPFCPYTANPGPDGVWTGPDEGKARRLIAASGTRGMRIKVWMPLFPFTPAIGEYFVDLLNDLGYRAGLKVVKDIPRYFGVVGDSRTKAQIMFGAWFADYPAPSGFIDPQLTCSSFLPMSPNNANYAEFCDAHIDSLVAQAKRAQTSSPGAVREIWSRIDRALVNRAPWVSLVNPREIHFISARTDNFQFHPLWGVLLDQLWVR
jgi:YVTN family beta-propeller protein